MTTFRTTPNRFHCVPMTICGTCATLARCGLSRLFLLGGYFAGYVVTFVILIVPLGGLCAINLCVFSRCNFLPLPDVYCWSFWWPIGATWWSNVAARWPIRAARWPIGAAWWSIGAVWRHTGAAQRASCYRVSAGTSSSPVVAASFSWECAEMGSAGLLTVRLLAATRRQAELEQTAEILQVLTRRLLMFGLVETISFRCLLDCNL